MNLSSLLSNIAPWLGAAAAGPAGLATMAISKLGGALGLDEPTEDSIKTALIGMTPEQKLAIQTEDDNFKVTMQTLGFKEVTDLAKIDADDRNSARQREMTVKDNTPKILAYAITIGFFGVLTLLIFKPVPDESRDILNIMLGVLGTAWIGVTGYYYGATSGSARTTELLAKSGPIDERKQPATK